MRPDFGGAEGAEWEGSIFLPIYDLEALLGREKRVFSDADPQHLFRPMPFSAYRPEKPAVGYLTGFNRFWFRRKIVADQVLSGGIMLFFGNREIPAFFGLMVGMLMATDNQGGWEPSCPMGNPFFN